MLSWKGDNTLCFKLHRLLPGLFLHGRRISMVDDHSQALGKKEALYQSQWEAKLSAMEDEEERHFCMLLESLGASNVFEE